MTATSAPISRRHVAVLFCAGSLSVLLFDLVTKWLVFNAYAVGQRRTLIPGLINLHVSRNAGAAFGMGKGFGAVFVMVSIAASIAMTWAAFKYGRHSRLIAVALALLVGGALGNVWDRLLHQGHVRDFIDLHVGTLHYPAIFNIADVAICVGCGLIVLHSFLSPEPRAGKDRAPKSKAAR